MKKGDILDRLSILILKTIYRDDIENEVYGLEELLSHFMGKDAKTLIELINLNNGIWALESAIRNDKKLDIKEVGRRTLEIRRINRQRVAVKNKSSNE